MSLQTTLLSLEKVHVMVQAQLFRYNSKFLLFHLSIQQPGKIGIFLPLEVLDDDGLVLENL
jgi:hypothetical protein